MIRGARCPLLVQLNAKLDAGHLGHDMVGYNRCVFFTGWECLDAFERFVARERGVDFVECGEIAFGDA